MAQVRTYCTLCGKWYLNSGMSCCVAHPAGTCCLEYDTQVEAPDAEPITLEERVARLESLMSPPAADQSGSPSEEILLRVVRFFRGNHENAGEELYGRINGQDLTPCALYLNQLLEDAAQALKAEKSS